MSNADYYRHEIAVLKSCMSLQHGHHIDSLPVESAIPPNWRPLVVAGASPTCQRIQQLERKLGSEEWLCAVRQRCE